MRPGTLTAKFPVLPALFALLAGMTTGAARAQQSPVPAPDQWVQVIVFRTLDPDAGDHEHWSHRLPTTLIQEGLPLPSRPKKGESAFRPAALGPKMQRVWAILRAAALYAPMLKLAWIQPALNFNSAIPVALNPVRKAKSPLAPGVHIRRKAAPSPALSRLSTTPLKPTVYGTVKITVLRHVYIAVHTVLVEGKPAPNPKQHSHRGPLSSPSASKWVLNVYPIHQANQVRPGRINYFDNPAYGVLVYVKAVPVTALTKRPPE